ncbi:glycohydrolase toxin TNT-related protein [Listeria fleischmannii]|uniref:glycohydrolase toxin TNT-related protein n=1 Tax=Listeria fleischmannii TaxID=1069827 RepID=UPI001626D7E7|nr:glycohydrolase toxin TNT-related protein [Listeria fleischmannii]MBC1418101.1 glycohydrolase toxin TNT-related protein [Listeria fleischmannii]
MSRIDIQEVRAFQHALKTANTTMRTRIEKMKAVALQYAGDTSLSGQAVESSKAYFQENYSAICDVLTEILNTSEDLLANYLNAFSTQVDSSPNAKIDAELLGEAVLKVKSIRRKQEALKQSLSGSTAGFYEGRAQTLRLDFVEAVEQEKILEKYLQFEQSYGNYFQDLLALVMTAKRTMQSLIRDVQFNDKTGTYVMPKGYSQTLASMKKRLDTVRGIDAHKQEALKEYDVIAVVYQDHYGKPQVMWLLEQNGVGVSHPELKKYLDKTGKYLNPSDYQIITNEELNKKINQSWQKGIYYMDGTKYSGAIGGTLRASAYVESVKGTLDESGLTDAVLGLGLSIAAIRGSTTFDKVDKWKNEDGSIKWPPNNGAIVGTEKIIALQRGETFGRIGSNYGKFVAPRGTNSDKLSLAPGTDTSIYKEYVVVREIPKVEVADVAPWFDKPGGGKQMLLPQSIDDLLQAGYIREIKK